MAKKKRPTAGGAPSLPRRLTDSLIEAQEALDRKRPAQARDLLEELDRKYPNQADVLGLLQNAYFDLNNLHEME
jgi:uncharacterized protein HemY